jgi:hypothetical protein
MVGFATGVAKRLILAEESAFAVSPVTGGKYIRRVSSDLTLNKDSYESQEILVSQQVQDARHGVRRPSGTLSGQLSPGSFPDIFQSIMRNNFATGSILATVTLALNTGTGTFTLAAGGLLAAGLKREDMVRITGAGAPNAALNGVNLRINTLSDTVITTRDLPTGLTTGSLVGVTVSVVGKKITMPATGQLYKSYSIEHWFSDVGQSELFIGCRFGQTSIAMPATGLVTFNSQMMGVDMVQALSQQLTTPSGPSTSSSLAAVNGKLSYNNVDQAIITGLNLTIAPALEAPAVVGSNTVPWIFMGRMRVSGNFTALFSDQTMANTFINETEVALSVILTMNSGASPDFIRLTLPRVKAMSDQKSDGEMSLIQSMSFTGLQNVADSSIDFTTLIVQDSLAA